MKKKEKKKKKKVAHVVSFDDDDNSETRSRRHSSVTSASSSNATDDRNSDMTPLRHDNSTPPSGRTGPLEWCFFFFLCYFLSFHNFFFLYVVLFHRQFETDRLKKKMLEDHLKKKLAKC